MKVALPRSSSSFSCCRYSPLASNMENTVTKQLINTFVHLLFVVRIWLSWGTKYSLVFTKPQRFIFVWSKDDWDWPFSLRWLCDFPFDEIVHFDFPKPPLFWAWTIWRWDDVLYVFLEGLGTVVCVAHTTKLAVLLYLKFGQIVYKFVSVLWVLLR